MKRRGTKKPITTYTSDSSDAEEPVPSKLKKRLSARQNEPKSMSLASKSTDDQDFEDTASKKPQTKKKKQMNNLKPVTVSDYFRRNANATEQQQFKATVEKCADDIESPGNSGAKSSAVKMVGSDLDELFELPSPSSKRPKSSPKKHAKSTPVKGKRAVQSSDKSQSSPKKAKPEKSFNRSRYAELVNREGPRQLGTKEIPEGIPDCLKGLTFVISGILESITIDDCKALIVRLGGRVTTAVSGKTDYLLLGRDGGTTKTAKAAELGVKVLSDDAFYDLIRQRSADTKNDVGQTMKSPKATSKPKTEEDSHEKTPKAERVRAYVEFMHREGPRALGSRPIPEVAEDALQGLTFVISGIYDSITREDCKTLIEKFGGRVTSAVSHKTNYLLLGRDAGATKAAKAVEFGITQLDEDGFYEFLKRRDKAKPKKEPKKEATNEIQPAVNEYPDDTSQLWVDKYKPKTLKEIIGQQGPKSCMNKLLHWLRQWQNNRRSSSKAPKRGTFPSANDDGSGFKAALLSGPPGIGKTTTAQLCCQELQLKYIELNASDSRSKKLLDQYFSASLGSHSIDQYMKNPNAMRKANIVDHVLIMDEVDGMSGNEDRAGMQELVALIKHSRVPIICICNDRQSVKVRTLANYCFDLRFHRPQVMQIRGAMMTIATRENLKIAPQALDQLIEASRHDIRQVLHNLSVLCAGGRSLSFDQARMSARKDVSENVFEATRKLFTASEQLSIVDRSTLFFNDYSMMPLFVQENYPLCTPSASSDPAGRMKLLAEAAKIIAAGDLVDQQLRSQGNWSLLNVQDMFSTTLPTELLKGYLQGRINFPSWFGKNSKAARLSRQLQQLHVHSFLRAPVDSSGLLLDYMDAFKDAVVDYLVEDRVQDAVQVCDAYDLSKEDLETVIELSSWSNDKKDPMSRVSTKTKSAFTRARNSSSHLLPYDTAFAGVRRKKTEADDTTATDDKPMLGLEGEGEEKEEINASSSSSDNEDDTEALLAALKSKEKKVAPKKPPVSKRRK